MKKTIEKILNSLRQLQIERRAILRQLALDHEMAVGSVSAVDRKCGKASCRCATGAGHPQTLFLFKGEDGRRICKLVRKDDVVRVTAAGEKYRAFREALRALEHLNSAERELLVALMEARQLHYE